MGKAKSRLVNPHDKTFKALFKDRQIAQDVLTHNLPEKVMQEIDLATLRLLDGSFISKALKESFTDVLYGARTENYDLYIAFLFEHKSRPDKYAIFQIAAYLFHIWESSLKSDTTIPFVIPIVFYHGKQKWQYPTDLRDYIPDYDGLLPYLKDVSPTFTHELINMADQDDVFIRHYEPVTRLIIRSFKYINDDIDILIEKFIISLDEMKGLVSLEKQEEIISVILTYYENANKEFTEDIFLEKVRQLNNKGGDMMNLLERREARALEQGLKQGKLARSKEAARAMLIDGISLEKVAEYTKLRLEQVKELAEEIQ